MHIAHIQPFEADSITIYPPFPDTSKTFRHVTILMMTEGFVDFSHDSTDIDGLVHHRECFSGPYHIEASINDNIYNGPANREE